MGQAVGIARLWNPIEVVLVARRSTQVWCRLAAFLTATLLAFGQSASPVEIPATPAGMRLGEWLRVFNTGELEAIRSFLQGSFAKPGGRNVGNELDFRRMTGGFELKKILESSPTKISAQIKERNSEQFAQVTIEVEPDQPHRITTFELRAIPRPADQTTLRTTEVQALEAVRKHVEEFCASEQFSGTVLVARSGQPLFSRACGWANRDAKVANQLDTKFNLGSMNKMFTAASILLLAQQEKLHINDPLGKYLTDYPNRDVAARVTLHDLLTHTGGIGDIFGPAFRQHRSELRDPKDYLALYGTRGLEFEPGSREEYSNYGFVLLGLVIEKVSGQSYYDYVRQNIYTPAGMKDTDSYFGSAAVPNRATGYLRAPDGSLAPNDDTLPPRGSPAGGGYSTAGDLLRFAQALLDYKLLNAEYTDLLTTGKVGPPGRQYAYGFADFRVDGVRMIGHNGGSPGVNGELDIYPASGYVVAVLSNLDPPSAGRVAQYIGARLLESLAQGALRNQKGASQ